MIRARVGDDYQVQAPRILLETDAQPEDQIEDAGEAMPDPIVTCSRLREEAETRAKDSRPGGRRRGDEATSIRASRNARPSLCDSAQSLLNKHI